MSGNVLIGLELLLVFGVVFGWGFNELHKLKKYKKADAEKNKARNPDDV